MGTSLNDRIVVRPPPALVGEAAARIVQLVQGALNERGRCALALAGGTSFKAAYEMIARAPGRVAWASVDIYFGDERAVPPDHPDSNYRMAREALLARVPIPAAQIHRMEGERGDLAAAAADYARLLPERLDVLLLGLGPDGHTASLFPGASALEERARVALVLDAPKPPPTRLTITPPVIAGAGEILVIATGREKADAVARAHAPGPVQELPARLAARGTWLIDPAAASGLEARA